MTTEEFTNIYWSQYIQLEKEFSQTLFYLSLDEANEEAYSQAYSKLMLEIGSEVDVVFKAYCLAIDKGFKKSYNKIGRYKDCMNNNKPEFIDQEVLIKNHNRKLTPWKEWKVLPDAPWWWTAYNKVKHHRTSEVEIDGVEKEAYKFANQKYALLALAGLYQIMVYFYHHLATAEGDVLVTPLPGSRLFELTGDIWDDVEFYGDSAFYINKEGHMMWATGPIHY